MFKFCLALAFLEVLWLGGGKNIIFWGARVPGVLARCSPVQEAVTKAGGMAALEQAIREGRVIKTMQNNMPMFWFPRFEFSKENLFRQKLRGEKQKGSLEDASFDTLADCKMGMDWEPASLISSALGSLPLSMPSSSPPLPLQGSPTSPLKMGSATPSSSLGVPFTAGGGA